MKVEVHQFIPEPLAGQVLQAESQVWLQQHVDLTRKQLNVIVSESGKGKSSLLNSIFGLRKDYHGTIFLDGLDIKNFTAGDWAEIRRSKMSMVFQSFQLFPELSVADNIAIKNDLTAHKTEKEIEQMLNELGLYEFRAQKAATLSLGQQQRLAVIRALCQDFSLILLDEPFSHLDPLNTAKALDLIKTNVAAKKARILISALHQDDIRDDNFECYHL
jgi:ABC-type lipoprotein export system ATPase subunit